MTVNSLRRASIRGRGSRLMVVVRVVVVLVMVSALLPPGDWFGASPALAQTGDTPAQTPPAGAGPFGDVPDQAFFSAPVVELEEAGVFDGTLCEPAMFCPDELIDRKTMAVWVVRIVDWWEPQAEVWTELGYVPVTSGFSDVDGQVPAFYVPFVARMSELGITEGCGDGSRFCPDEGVSRAHMAVFLSRLFKRPVDVIDPEFTDIERGAWYRDHVAGLAASGITQGCDQSRFCPDSLTTRAQMATFLFRGLTSSEVRSGPGMLTVHYCGPQGAYTSDKLKTTVEGLNATVRRFFEVESSYLTRISFRQGKILVPAHADWSDHSDSGWQMECREAAGRSDERAIYVMGIPLYYSTDLDIAVAGFAHDGGPAFVQTYSDINYLVAHEVGHAFYSLGHPWVDEPRLCFVKRDTGGLDDPVIDEECSAVLRLFGGNIDDVRDDLRWKQSYWDRKWDQPPSSTEIEQNEIDNWDGSLMGYGPILGFDFSVDPPAREYVACRHKQMLGWPLGAGCEFLVTPADPVHELALGSISATTISAGDGHTCGIRTDNTVVCWGRNDEGQLDVPSGKFIAIAAGGKHSCGIRTDNTVVCWGRNFHGQLDVPSGRFIAIAAGEEHSCGIRTDNGAVCWGYPLADPGKYRWHKLIAISAGGGYTCGILADNTAVCWGATEWSANSPGVFATLPGKFIAISAGRNQSCGIRPDNTAACWVSGISSQGGTRLVTGTPSGEFISISAGADHWCGIRADSSAVCSQGSGFWGWLTEMEAPSDKFVAISAGYGHSCGIRTDGTATCWPDDEDGQGDAPSGKFLVNSR